MQPASSDIFIGLLLVSLGSLKQQAASAQTTNQADLKV